MEVKYLNAKLNAMKKKQDVFTSKTEWLALEMQCVISLANDGKKLLECISYLKNVGCLNEGVKSPATCL